MDFRFVGARASISSHVNGQTSENQNRADRKGAGIATADVTFSRRQREEDARPLEELPRRAREGARARRAADVLRSGRDVHVRAE